MVSQPFLKLIVALLVEILANKVWPFAIVPALQSIYFYASRQCFFQKFKTFLIYTFFLQRILSSNKITSLPDRVFTGVTSLASLWVKTEFTRFQLYIPSCKIIGIRNTPQIFPGFTLKTRGLKESLGNFITQFTGKLPVELNIPCAHTRGNSQAQRLEPTSSNISCPANRLVFLNRYLSSNEIESLPERVLANLEKMDNL